MKRIWEIPDKYSLALIISSPDMADTTMAGKEDGLGLERRRRYESK